MFSAEELARVPRSAKDAIQRAAARVDRAASLDDVEAIIGSSKDLVETVAKTVIDALGGTYGSATDLPRLGNRALEALDLYPAGLHDRPALRRLSQAQLSTVEAISTLRNSDGTGHGRSAPSSLDRAHADLVRNSAVGWCRWIIASANRALVGMVTLDQVMEDLGGRVFHRGQIPAFLEEHQLEGLGEENQRKLGLVAGRRWSSGGTFLMLEDLIEPLAEGRTGYPPAFAEGVLEGLLLDPNGYLLTTERNANLAVQIALRLPVDRRRRALQELARSVEDALPSDALTEDAKVKVPAELRQLAALVDDPPVNAALESIADRFQLVADVGAEWDVDEDG